MSSMLNRIFATLVVVTLSLAIFAALPEAAEAQEVDPTREARATEQVVVAPGDSLWSISAQMLGSGATAQQIQRGAERIYALNRDRIGPDPDLIFPGQRLLVPATPEATKAVSSTVSKSETPQKIAEEARSDTQSRITDSSTNQPSRKSVVDEKAAASNAKKAVALAAEPADLPDGAAAPRIPAVSTPATRDSSANSPVAPFLRSARSMVASGASALDEAFAAAQTPAGKRLILGWTIILLALVVGALMAWKLPMRRTTRRDAEGWGIPAGYYGAYPAYRGTPPGLPDGSVRPKDLAGGLEGSNGHKRRAGGEPGKGGDTPTRNGATGHVAPGGTARSGQWPERGALRRSGLATGVHDPGVRRALLRARAEQRLPKGRHSGRGTRRLGPSAALKGGGGTR